MMELFFNIGGSVVQLTAPEGSVDISGSNLEVFRIEPREAEFHMEMELVSRLDVPDLIPVFTSPERRVYLDAESVISVVGGDHDPYLRLDRRGKFSRAQVKADAVAGVLRGKIILSALEIEHLITESEGILLHSSFISHQGQAILFTAPSGTGKSTQAELWRCHRNAQVINGDRSVVKRGEGGFEALGIPFSGSSGICVSARLPLRAVVVLSQAPENSIQKLRGAAAFRAIWEGCSLHTWNRRDVSCCTQIVSELIGQVPVYHLACTPDVRAVETLETQLSNEV